MAKKKRDPKALVGDCVPGRAKQSWWDILSNEDRNYVCDVVAAMANNPSAAPYVVARQLKQELQLDRHPDSIARTLKEMLHDAETKT